VKLPPLLLPQGDRENIIYIYIYIYLLLTAIGLMPGGIVYKDHTVNKETAHLTKTAQYIARIFTLQVHEHPLYSTSTWTLQNTAEHRKCRRKHRQYRRKHIIIIIIIVDVIVFFVVVILFVFNSFCVVCPFLFVYFFAVFCLSVVCYLVWCVLFVCCVLLYYHCHRLKTRLQLK
jgi:hypothetical protein